MSQLNQMNRLHQILLILLVVQIALGVMVFWPQSAASQASGPLLADISPDEVSQLVISDGEGNQVVIARKDDGWVLPEAGDYPVTEENVTSLLENLEAVQTNRLVTQTEASHRRLQVAEDEFNRRVEITLANGDSHTVYIGSSGGASATHVRVDGQPEVYLTGDLDAFEVNPQSAGWVDTLYFTIPQTATTRLTLENGNGAFVFTHENDSWSFEGLAEGEIFDESALTSLINQVSSVRMTEPIGTEEEAAFGLDAPQAIATLETPEETYTLSVGAQDPEKNNSYVFKASNSPYYVRVATFTGDNLVNKTREDFLQEPPTPAAETGDGEGEGEGVDDATGSE